MNDQTCAPVPWWLKAWVGLCFVVWVFGFGFLTGSKGWYTGHTSDTFWILGPFLVAWIGIVGWGLYALGWYRSQRGES